MARALRGLAEKIGAGRPGPAHQRCAWRTVRRGRERADYWRWVWTYRRQSLPAMMDAIRRNAPHARLYLLRGPRAVRRFAAGLRRAADATAEHGHTGT